MLNPRILLTSIGAAIAVATALGLVFYTTMPGASLEEDAFLPRLQNLRIELRSGEAVRTVELYEDGITPRRAIAENADGKLSTFNYHPDGKQDTLVIQSAADEKGNRKILRSVTYAADGRTLAHDVEYNLAGVIVKDAKLIEPNLIKRSYFFEDGQLRKAQSIRLEYGGWILRDETVLRTDRTVARTLISSEHGAFVDTAFADDGKRIVSVKKRTATYGLYTEVAFAENGIKIREVTQDQTETTMLRRDLTGRVFEKYSWTGEIGKTSMMLEVFAEDGKLLYSEWWNSKNGKPVLWLYREHFPDKGVRRQVIFADDGKTVDAEILYKSDGKAADIYSFIRRKFRPDGTVATEEDVVKNVTQSTKEFSVEDNVRIDIEVARLRLSDDFAAPPQVVPYSPPGPH